MIEVMQSGFFSTIQDLGRNEYRHLGVPVSGVMDTYAARIANTILGNKEYCALLEITMVGPKLLFKCDTVIAVTGSDMSPSVNGHSIQNNTAVNIFTGDVLSFGKLKTGLRSYISVLGGLDTNVLMGSRSMYAGITLSSKLNLGDEIKIKSKNHINVTYSSVKVNCDYLKSKDIKVFKGPEFDQLNEQQKIILFEKKFTIAKENNRMAYQIKELINNELKEIITSFVIPGTVQLTPSGKLIILMRDCQTTGGYPRILQLSASSIDKLSQKLMNESIMFKLLDNQQ